MCAESPGDQYPTFHLEIPYPKDESITLTWEVGQQTPSDAGPHSARTATSTI